MDYYGKKKKSMTKGENMKRPASDNGPTHHNSLHDDMSESYSRGAHMKKKSNQLNSMSPRNKMPKARDY